MMSIALKHIPCPAGNKCTAFRCIFGHEKDLAVGTLPAEEGSEKSRHDDEASLSSHQPPRKRLKVDQETSVKLAPDSPSQKSTDDKDAGGTKRPAEKLQTATRPVSPPPLKRPPASTRTGTASSNPPSATSKKPTSSTNHEPSTMSGNGPSKQNKAESLNPRLLKSSPASHEIRFKLLRMVHQEFSRLNSELKKNASDQVLKLVLSDQDLIIRALDEEQKTALEKSAVYANVMKNKVMQYKRMGVAQWKTEREKETEAAVQTRGGNDASDGPPKKIETGLTQAQEVELLRRIITPIDKLSGHGYVAKMPTEESIKATRKGLMAAKGWEACDRCQQRFQVFPGRREEDGALTTGGSCKFHWGKTYVPAKAPGDKTRVSKRYQCCSQEIGESAGCFTHDHHVHKFTDATRLAAVLNFAETPENSLPPADRAVCFDCEMGYTVYGLELIRLTATSWPTGEELLDVLVQPLGEILDLNSRFSGVWPEDLAQAESWTADNDPTPSKSGTETCSEEGEIKPAKRKLKKVSSPEVARDLLFSLLSPSTPLIGHGLENDLNAVRIIHPTLIDTVLLYPHRGGLPFRHSLKRLMDVHLNHKIQQETGVKMLGHDSAEDARAAGDLVRLKVMSLWKDMKRDGWTLVDDEFVAPGKQSSKEGKLTEKFIES
ncbi:RNA exonuclease 3 [Tolypocladium paradoxum]|uniref:RNA exonuclease 3 n=1 Tax=Tolypocladium paradoxum TaxID=94208 RepID=A0A2S4LA22_9HYPO|nr:RNA exonuclease 3 [Tolypocladium paradoxum]